VAWAAGTSGYDTVLYTSTTDGINWTKINDIVAVPQNGIESASTRPAMWIDNSGFLNLSYVSFTLYYTRASIDEAGSAAAWPEPQKLNSGQVAYFSRLLQDTHGQLHLIYTENVISNNCTQCYHLFHRVSANNGVTWSDAVDISADGTGAAKPQIIQDDKGGIFVVWESGTGGGQGQLGGPSVVKFVASYDYGKTWSNAVTLSPTGSQEAKNITIGLDGSGRMVAVWLNVPDDIVSYVVSTDSGKTWSQPHSIDGINGSWSVYSSKLDDYSIVADSSGALHLVMVGQLNADLTPTATPIRPTPEPTTTPLYVLHLTWQNDEWSQPEVITEISGDVPEWPRAAISTGNVLNVVWFVRDQADIWNSDNSHYRIWYARKELNAPALPTVMPTISTMTPMQPDVAVLTPTLTPATALDISLPTLSPDEKLPSKATYSENDYVAILAKSLAPAVLLFVSIGLILLFLRRRR
jgi:hypothetical protein